MPVSYTLVMGPPERERISMWLDSEIARQIEDIADRETEGNFSLTTRTLLREALAARRDREAAR